MGGREGLAVGVGVWSWVHGSLGCGVCRGCCHVGRGRRWEVWTVLGCFCPLIGRVAPCWGCWGVVCIMVFLIVKRLIQRVFSGVFVGVVCNYLEGQKEVILTFVMAIFALKTYRKPP